jgi:hypothetical protein
LASCFHPTGPSVIPQLFATPATALDADAVQVYLYSYFVPSDDPGRVLDLLMDSNILNTTSCYF